MAKRLAAALNCLFDYPTGGTRIQLLRHPEIHVAALVVVATKLCFPLESRKPSPPMVDSLPLPRLDWERWRSSQVPARVGGSPSGSNETEFRDMTPDKIANMSDEGLEEYLVHVASFIDTKSGFFFARVG